MAMAISLSLARTCSSSSSAGRSFSPRRSFPQLKSIRFFPPIDSRKPKPSKTPKFLSPILLNTKTRLQNQRSENYGTPEPFPSPPLLNSVFKFLTSFWTAIACYTIIVYHGTSRNEDLTRLQNQWSEKYETPSLPTPMSIASCIYRIERTEYESETESYTWHTLWVNSFLLLFLLAILLNWMKNYRLFALFYLAIWLSS